MNNNDEFPFKTEGIEEIELIEAQTVKSKKERSETKFISKRLIEIVFNNHPSELERDRYVRPWLAELFL